MVATATNIMAVNAIESNKTILDTESSRYTTAHNNNTIDYVSLSMEQKISIVQKAIDDSRMNPANKIIIPGATEITPDVYYPNTTKIGKPLVDKMPSRPLDKPKSSGDISPLTIMPNEYMNYYSSDSPDYAATYIQVGDNPQGSNRARSATAVIPGGSNLQNFITGEIFVMHQWGVESNAENDLVIGGGSSTTVDITPFIRSYPNPWLQGVSVPNTHTYSLTIDVLDLNGQEYRGVLLQIFDLTTWTWVKQWYVTFPGNLPQHICKVDMTLEECYPSGYVRPGPQLVWRTAQQFRGLDVNLNTMNIVYTGNVFEWVTSDVSTAYYHDLSSYNGVTNGQGNFYYTRYVGSYPQHP